MPAYEITTPSGQRYEVTAPDGATQEAILDFAMRYVPKSARSKIDNDAISKGAREFPGEGVSGKVLSTIGGLVKGASDLGTTLMDQSNRKLAQPALESVPEKFRMGVEAAPSRAEIEHGVDASLADAGADKNSAYFKGGRVGAQVLGTLGVGPALAAPLRAAGAAGPVVDAVATGLETGGFRVPGLAGTPALAARVGTGAVVGGASAAAANPDEAALGVAIGAVLPPAIQVGGTVLHALGNIIRNARTPEEVRIAKQLAEELGVTADDLAAATTGPQIIPGHTPTVPQLLQTPEASQLQRTLKTAGGHAISDAEHVQQQQLQQTMRGIAPVADTLQDAANTAGHAIQDYAIPAERQASRHVSELFDAIPGNEATMQLPLREMQGAQARYLGPGTFGKGGQTAEQAMQAATHIGTDPLSHGVDARAVPFEQIQALRSSIGEAITDAITNGRNQAAAALTAMKNAIDNKIADVASGNALPGEVFTPEAIDTWGQALAAHAAKKQQFATGPQAAMFRQGGDGAPAIQGAEIPGKFFNGNRSQVEDVQAFKRLIGNRNDLMQVMKGYALTEANATTNQAGDLTQKFLNWMESRSGATRELFTPEEMLKLKEMGRLVQKSVTAENLGRVSGPDTAQKLASLQRNGLIDSKAVDFLARRIPIIGQFTGPALDGLRANATRARQGTMDALLADPARMEDALRRGAAPPAAQSMLGSVPMGTALPVAGAALFASPAIAQPKRDPMQDLAQAQNIDEAIAAAGAAVSTNASKLVLPPPTPAPTAAPAPVRDAQIAPATPGGETPVGIWTGRRGAGFPTEEDARRSLVTRMKVEPDLRWEVERMPNGVFRLAAYQPAAEQQQAQSAHAQSPTAMMDDPTGTIRQKLKQFGIGFIPAAGGKIQINRLQAAQALDLLGAQ